MSNSNLLNPATLLSSSDQRLTLQATLQPVGNIERFQPAGFPEIGHVIYDAPHAVMETKKKEDGTETEIHAKDKNGDPKWTSDKVCIVDSAASMANHLETVCLASPFGAGLADELKGLPYVECVTDGDKPDAHRLVVTTFSEGHRLASSLFTDEKSRLLKGGKRSNENLGTNLLSEFGLVNLGKRSHPLPQDWWNVFKTIFKYDPNSLVHGIFFPAMGIRIPRLLTAHLEAFGAARVASAGVKFDKLLMTTSGQPIFAVDEETAREIRATFVIDLALLRSFGRIDVQGDKEEALGLSVGQKQLLLALALWKIGRLLRQPFRYRSGCDLELSRLRRTDAAAAAELTIDSLNIDIATAIRDAGFPANPVTQVHWPANEIFKKAKEKAETSDEEQAMDQESEEKSGETVDE